MVKVYFGVGYDIANDAARTSRRMGTLDALHAAELKPLLETERTIDPQRLDGDGFWTPTAAVRDA